MPPKRKAAAAKPASKAKKSKVVEEEEAGGKMKDQIQKLKSADKGKVKKFKPDSLFPWANAAEVHEDYDAMLNQTNIGHNNNKYYIIQVLKMNDKFYAWNRWGRVGEPGQTSNKGPFPNVAVAIQDFEKKYRDKTKNKWEDRASFKPVPGKYTLLEMAGDEEDEDDDEAVVETVAVTPDGAKVETAACTLDKATQGLISLIFDNDMFKETLKKFDIDVKKMPLGKLSKAQIATGFEALEDIEKAIETKKSVTILNQLSSRFYTVIPHSFGRAVPPPLKTIEQVQKKYDMLAVLGDIEIAQSIQKDKAKKGKKTDSKKAPHPLDVNYELLNCGLEVLDSESKEYEVLEEYFNATNGDSGLGKLREIWSVDRAKEAERFAVHKNIKQRKLLWHGTDVAVVTAILKTGLRIMPHSGGRVGKGIYFASENSKSAGYVGPAQDKVIMFLNEVAIGKQHLITMDNSSLKTAPKGYDSVLACGQNEPDSTYDTTIKLGGKDVIVPQGNPKFMPEYSNSNFDQSEYLIYREDQCRIRYLLLFDEE